MKTDKLEQFMLDNRAGFGPDAPTPDVWQKVTKRQPQGASLMQISWRRVATRAASVAIIFVVSYYFHDFMSGREENKQAQASIKENPLLNDLREADIYYTAEIEYKKQELFSLTNNSPALQMDVTRDLADLDAVLLELREDLKDNADNQEVIEAMMQNYRLKLEILEDLMNQIKSKSENEQADEAAYSI